MSGEKKGEEGGWAYVALDGSETTLVGVFLDAGRAHAELARYCLEAFGRAEVPSWCSVERVRVGLSTIDHEEDLYARTCLADEVGASGSCGGSPVGQRSDGAAADGKMGSRVGGEVGVGGEMDSRGGSPVEEVGQRSGGGADALLLDLVEALDHARLICATDEHEQVRLAVDAARSWFCNQLTAEAEALGMYGKAAGDTRSGQRTAKAGPDVVADLRGWLEAIISDAETAEQKDAFARRALEKEPDPVRAQLLVRAEPGQGRDMTHDSSDKSMSKPTSVPLGPPLEFTAAPGDFDDEADATPDPPLAPLTCPRCGFPGDENCPETALPAVALEELRDLARELRRDAIGGGEVAAVLRSDAHAIESWIATYEKPVECICARDSHLAGLPVARVPQCPAHRSGPEKTEDGR